MAAERKEEIYEYRELTSKDMVKGMSVVARSILYT